MPFFVYILANRRNGTLYVGRTSDLHRRMLQHRMKALGGFNARHDVRRLVHYRVYETLEAACLQERRMKRWRREWKLNVIERDNPHWSDLFVELFGDGSVNP